MVRKPHGVTVKYMDFCDPQGGTWVGKGGGGGLDRRSAVIKSHMKIYPNSGNNIETSKEIKKAIFVIWWNSICEGYFEWTPKSY